MNRSELKPWISQSPSSRILSGFRRKLLGIGIALTLSLITLPVKAEGLVVADKPAAEKTASVPLTIQP